MAAKKTATKKKAAAKPAKKNAAKKTAKKTVKKTVKKAVAAAKTKKKPVKSSTPAKRAKKPVKAAPMQPAASSSLKPRMSKDVVKRKSILIKILLKKRNEVVEGLESQMGRKLARESGQKIDSAMDSGDQSVQDVDSGLDYSLLEMKYGQYKDIADAFRKLQSDSYGICEECGQDIAIKRLEVNPLARFCIECKTRKEEMENIQKEETRFKE